MRGGHGGDTGALEAFVKHPDDPSWPLVARTVESHDGGEVGIGRRTGDGRRAGMGHLGDHGAERDHHRGVDRGCDLGDGIAEGSPEQVGFDPLDQHEITGLVG